MTKSQDEEGFISRWSRRKLDDETQKDLAPDAELAQSVDVHSEHEQQDKNVTSTPNDELPIWQQKDVDPELKKSALRDLFHQAEFNERDGLNDYDHDYTKERKLGDIVTAQMKRMIKLAQQKTDHESESTAHIETTPSLPVQAESTEISTDHNEDDKLA